MDLKTMMMMMMMIMMMMMKSFYSLTTWELPGKRDCVSTGKNHYMSKRLILCNLSELYTLFKDKHPLVKISFSKFASLRKGTHCVCTIHQNLKLMLESIKLQKDYHEIVEMIICERFKRLHDTQMCILPWY